MKHNAGIQSMQKDLPCLGRWDQGKRLGQYARMKKSVRGAKKTTANARVCGCPMESNSRPGKTRRTELAYPTTAADHSSEQVMPSGPRSNVQAHPGQVASACKYPDALSY